ncbi:hypothetical protein MHU86_12461 [Fragilaria crotonensis]|nr:hypothetical protein MHU86_12461 [Fragilaria crotonensis]
MKALSGNPHTTPYTDALGPGLAANFSRTMRWKEDSKALKGTRNSLPIKKCKWTMCLNASWRNVAEHIAGFLNLMPQLQSKMTHSPHQAQFRGITQIDTRWKEGSHWSPPSIVQNVCSVHPSIELT